MSWLVVNWKRNSHYNIRYCDIASLRWIFWYRRCWWAPALGISGWLSEWVPPAGRISTTRATNSELLSPAGNRPPASTIYPCVEASFQLHYIYVEKHLFNAGVKTDASTLTKTDICTNSNMLKTNIVEPTLLITKKTWTISNTSKILHDEGDHLTHSDDVFDQAVKTSQKWLTTNPFHSFWSDL